MKYSLAAWAAGAGVAQPAAVLAVPATRRAVTAEAALGAAGRALGTVDAAVGAGPARLAAVLADLGPAARATVVAVAARGRVSAERGLGGPLGMVSDRPVSKEQDAKRHSPATRARGTGAASRARTAGLAGAAI